MKLAVRGLFLLVVLGTALSRAQSTAIQHIIVVVQENRTPDNLFQDQKLINAGADIVQTGACSLNGIPLKPRPLADCYDLNHYHVAWNSMYDSGKMDGACNINVIKNNCSGGPPAFPQYVYADNSSGTIQPYWDIAEKYGYANYFFQTNQGPSFPAHQFLLSGTSAPNGGLNSVTPFYSYFAMDNPGGTFAAGCNSTGSTVALISPTGDQNTQVAPCFDHPTLTDLLDQNQISWRYYGKQADSIWLAPNAISHICNNTGQGTPCGTGSGSNHDWNNDVGLHLEGQTIWRLSCEICRTATCPR
jgi:hypothetical protein